MAHTDFGVVDGQFFRLMDWSVQRQRDELERMLSSGEIERDSFNLLRDLLHADMENCSQRWLEASAAVGLEGASLLPTETFDNSDTDPATKRVAAQPEPQQIGKYLILQQLGRGTFGVVYDAVDTIEGKEVALKVPRFPIDSQEDANRFLAEGARLAKLRHENIVEVYNADRQGDDVFIAMEKVEGQDLRQYMSQNESLSLLHRVRLMAQVGAAMTYAHRNGVIHRDLKPENILVADSETGPVAKVGDFGLAIRTDQPNPAGEYAGTTSYMSPEQIEMRTDDLQGDTDVWAVGAILYEVLSGKRPFAGDRAQVANAILNQRQVRLLEITDDLPEALIGLCDECLKKDAADRPGAREVARRLDEMVAQLEAEEKAEVPQPSWWKRLAMALFLVALSTVITAWVLKSQRGKPQAGEWQAVLGKQPVDLKAGLHDEPFPWGYNEESASVQAHGQDILFLKLGQATQTNYWLEIEFIKDTANQPSGEAGIFLGYTPQTQGDRQSWDAQVICLDCPLDNKGDYRVIRYRMTKKYTQRIRNGQPAWEPSVSRVKDRLTNVANPGMNPMTLRLHVVGGYVKEVMFNGRVLDDLDDEPRASAMEAPGLGDWGLYNSFGATHFLKARFKYESN